MSAPEEPSPEGRIGDDPVCRDHAAQRRAAVRLFGEAGPRHDIRASGGIPGEVHESSPAALGQGLSDTSRTTAWCPDQHGFHRAPTMPRRPTPCGHLAVGSADEIHLTGGCGSVR